MSPTSSTPEPSTASRPRSTAERSRCSSATATWPACIPSARPIPPRSRRMSCAAELSRPAPGGDPICAGIPGFDGSGITVALLDTGIDITHPYIRDRLLDGADMLDPEAGRCAGSPGRCDAARAPWHADGRTDRRPGRSRRHPGCCARRVDPADPSRGLAAERRRRLCRLRPHRPTARRARAGGRPGRRRRRPGRRARLRSSASPSRSPPSRTGLSRSQWPEPPSSTPSSSCRLGTKGRRGPTTAASVARVELRLRSPSVPQTCAARPRRFGSSCGPASASSSTGSFRSPARPRRARR